MFRHFDADAWKFHVMTCVKRYNHCSWYANDLDYEVAAQLYYYAHLQFESRPRSFVIYKAEVLL